ncbi:MAG: hypothetical protein ABJO27_04945 [Pseudoruegeria sp.]
MSEAYGLLVDARRSADPAATLTATLDRLRDELQSFDATQDEIRAISDRLTEDAGGINPPMQDSIDLAKDFRASLAAAFDDGKLVSKEMLAIVGQIVARLITAASLSASEPGAGGALGDGLAGIANSAQYCRGKARYVYRATVGRNGGNGHKLFCRYCIR